VLERQAGMMAEDERDRAGPEQGRERRDRKSTLRRKKKRDRSGTKDRGNKPDGEFEGDEVNGDRRRMDGEEAARQAGRQAGRLAGWQGKCGWLTKGNGSGTEEERGEAIGVEKFNCAYFRSDVSQILRPSPSCTAHPPSAAPPTHPLSPLLSRNSPSPPLSFILHSSLTETTGDVYAVFLPPARFHPDI